MDIHAYVGDSQETPYECAHQTIVPLSTEKFDENYFLSLQCSEVAPEGQTLKIKVQSIYTLQLNEVEVYGRSLSGKYYYSLD